MAHRLPAGPHQLEPPDLQRGITLDGDDNEDDAHEHIYHQADVFPGQSGGPMFGFWDGDAGPARWPWQNPSRNGASGAGDLAIRARTDYP